MITPESFYLSKTRLYAEYIKLKYPIPKSASSAMTTLRFSAVDSEAARTARMTNATTRTKKRNKWKERNVKPHKVSKTNDFLLTCAKESEGIVDMSRMYE